MICVESAGPMPFTASSSAWLARLASTAACAATARKSAASAARIVFSMVVSWSLRRPATGWPPVRCVVGDEAGDEPTTRRRAALSRRGGHSGGSRRGDRGRVARDSRGDIGERVVAAGGAQPPEVGLGEALVLADQRSRKVDVLDEAALH